MFWSDPSLYSAALRDIPPVQPPFFGQQPILGQSPYGTMTPWQIGTMTPWQTFPKFVPPTYPPALYNFQQVPFTPYHTAAFNPYFTPFNLNPAFYAYYRPYPF